MKRSLSFFAAALALSLAAAAQSRADVAYYNWTPDTHSIPFVQKNNTSLNGSGGITLIDPNGTGFVPFEATLGTAAPAANFTVISTVDDTNPDWITPTGGKYSLSLQLAQHNPADPANNGQPIGAVSFQLQIQPQNDLTALSAILSNTVLSSTDPSGTHPGQNFAQVQVGADLFTVTYSGFSQPGDSSETVLGGVSFVITDAPVITGGKTPEPTSMVLGCLGLSLLGGVAWRARRRKALALKAMA